MAADTNLNTRKIFTCDIAKQDSDADTDDDRTLNFVISTGAVDRQNDTIAPAGWNFDEFRETGVVLWAHDASLPPIAEPLDVKISGNKVISRAKFGPADLAHPLGMGFGHSVYRMYKLGLLKSVSVGFDPTKWMFNEERGEYAVDFLEQSLREYSAVPIAANQEANLVQLAKANDIDMRPIYNWCEHSLDTDSAVAHRDAVETMYKSLASEYRPSLCNRIRVAVLGKRTVETETDKENEQMEKLAEQVATLANELKEAKGMIEKLICLAEEAKVAPPLTPTQPTPVPEKTLADLLGDKDFVTDFMDALKGQFDDKLREITGSMGD